MSNPFGGICVNKKPRTLHADVPTPHNSLLTTNSPKTCSFCSFVEKYTKLYTKSLKTALKTALYTPVQLPPPPIKYLIICYLILYTFVHCFSLSFLTLILILQRKSLRTNKNFYPMTKKTFLLTCLLGMSASGIHAYQGATKRVLHSK